ncbi:S8 family serine peptidase [Plantactinospora endophytica]|uniref:Serine protease n=1 Tax=Plantactinospora endophytica TaxID=673535 RepID=A0ABQ4E0Z3_9ACTN|nr:S8 family serine peptidase [Plantactinospora endophytica]GIG88335.1 serine protease [Plantactinospora endophytica]
MRRRSTRWGGGLAVAAFVVSFGGAAGPAGKAPAAAAPAPAADVAERLPEARSVTLVTGDLVTVGADGNVGLAPGAGRDDISIQARRVGGRLHVMPADAEPLVRAGRVDARLFDVTTLLESGYDDRRADLPLIVTSTGNLGAARGTVTGPGARVIRELPAVRGLAVRADKPELAELWRELADGAGPAALRGGVSTLWLDGVRKPTLEQSVPQIGAPSAWQGGLDGTGVKVAVLDGGVDAGHPDLAGQVAGQANFTEGMEDDRDLDGHGTHVASTIAGTGAASDGRNKGVAPGARLLDGKVCVVYGCLDSWILAGMQWAVEQGASVVNISLGGTDTPEVDPVEQAVQSLTERHGTLFVISAGNEGADATIGSPASAEAALTVGAVNRADELAWFSSRGPRLGDGGLKPDLTAPGVDIVAANSRDASDGPTGQPYVTMSGTSMATPHVAGAAAILAQRHPEWTAGALKATLMASARPRSGLSAYAQGAGRVDVARAVGQTVRADPPSVGFGLQMWPPTDDVPMAKTVTYHNRGSAPVTLALTAEGTGPDGRPAPAGMFTSSATTVTVPAGGSAQVTLTADTRVGGPTGYYTGRLVGTADGLVVQTPFAIEREAESYPLTLVHTNRAGKATDDYYTVLHRLDEPDGIGGYEPYDADGTVTIRLPKGRYALVSAVNDRDGANRETSLLAQPALELTAATTVAVDGRRAKPVSATSPRPDATPLFFTVAAEIEIATGTGGIVVGGDPAGGTYTGLLGGGGTIVPGFVNRVYGMWERAGTTAEAPSPYQYNLAWYAKGTMFDGFRGTVRPGELATVRARYDRGAYGDGVRLLVGEFPVMPGFSDSSLSRMVEFEAPFARTEYFNTEGGVRWAKGVQELLRTDEDPFGRRVSSLSAPPVTYWSGTVTATRWNQAVFGPTFEGYPAGWPWVARRGDELDVRVPLFGDGAGRSTWSAMESARFVLYRDGDRIAEADSLGALVEVPAAAADYRIEATATRGAPFALSTTVAGVWTFRSGHVPGDGPVPLPLAAVRFSPELDQWNAAPAGRPFSIPVSVRPQPGAPAARTRSLTVDVSYDDGATWRPAQVVAPGGTGVARVAHPAAPGFVSLRATATDSAGNTVRQTVIRAYEIR